ncbi:hypothetical protein BH10BAC5_BH10BAC5_24510 [soil metagenome]
MKQDLFSQEADNKRSQTQLFNKIKSIDELYREVKDHDLVLTIDAPLATALNKRSLSETNKKIAFTPRQLTSENVKKDGARVFTDFELLKIISEKEKSSYRYFHPIVESILHRWQYYSTLDEIDEFSSFREKSILKYFMEYPVLEKYMMDFDISALNKNNIAVINEDSFSILEKLFIPPGFNYTAVTIQKEENYNLPATYVFGSSKALIEKTISLITPENMNDAAIVISTDSEDMVLLKSKLLNKGISIIDRVKLSRLPAVRTLLHLMETGLKYNELVAGDLMLFSGMLGLNLSNENSSSDLKDFLSGLKNEKLNNFAKFLSGTEKLSFSRFAEISKDFSCIPTDEYFSFLKEAGLENTKITESSFIDLKYILKNFDKEIYKNEEGLLFADPGSSSYIDRKFVIYLEMDNTWTKQIPERIYYDRYAEEEKALNSFKTLLQQGSKRMYFVKSQSLGKKISPCYYFNYFEDVKDFNNNFFSPLSVKSGINEKIIPKKLTSVSYNEPEGESLNSFSPSSLNEYFMCPKKYQFSRISKGPELPHLTKGTLIHEYAEMYFHYPEFCREHRKEVLDKILSLFKKMYSSVNEKLSETEFRVAMISIEEFLDREKFKTVPINSDGLNEVQEANSLMSSFNLKKKYSNTEMYKRSDDCNIRGKIDLLSDKTIVDYKSGKIKKSVLDNVVTFVLDCENKDFDFQSLSYIKLVYDIICKPEDRSKNLLEIEMIFYHMLCNIEADFTNETISSSTRVKSASNETDERLNKIRFFNISFKEFMKSESFEEICSLNGKDLKLHFGSNFKKMVDELVISTGSFSNRDKLLTECFDVIEKYFINVPKLKESPETFLKFLYRIRRGEYGKTILTLDSAHYFFYEDLLEFSELVKQKLEKINQEYKTFFPAEPLFDDIQICKDCNYLSICSKNLLFN